jgi:hypothetical protein
MKNVLFLVIISLILSCSGSKPIINKSLNKETQSQKLNDSVLESSFVSLNKTSKINNEKEKKIVMEDTTEFNQILTKRFISIHELWNELLGKHVSDDGIVNYKSFKTEHKKLLDYIYVLNLGYKYDNLKSLNKEEKLSYWINAYNALTIDLILRHYPLNSIKDINNPWDQRLWKFGEKWLNLNNIEHEILRKMNEPRIHFAIVCASVSCPKLQNEAFEASKLETQLTQTTKAFLADSKRNNITENDLELSKIFQWFVKDFKQNGSLIDFLNKYSDVKISSKAKITYKDYNWNLNE